MVAAALTQVSSTARSMRTPSRRTHATTRPPLRLVDSCIRIADTTLCELHQSPGATMTDVEKLTIAGQLVLLRVDSMEVGFSASSQDNLCTARTIARLLGQEPIREDGFVPIICVLSRCSKEDVDESWAIVRLARHPRINILMECKPRKTPDQVVASATEMVAYARSLGCPDVQFSIEDAGSTNRDFLYRILGDVIKAGAATISIGCDEYTYPYEFGNLIADIKANTPDIANAIVSTRCQNGGGLATANTITGAKLGARQLEVSINGFGDRAGTASLEEVVLKLKFLGEVRRESFCTGIDCRYITPTSKMVGTKRAEDNCAANEKEGFLDGLDTFVRNLFAFCIVFFGWSCAYPLVPKAALVVGDQRMQFIIIASGILIFVSWKLHCQSSYFKTSKSTDGAWFQIFKFLVLAVLLFLDAVLSIALLFCEKIALPVTLAFGLTVGTIIFFVWFWAFYIKWRQITEDVKDGNVRKMR